METLGMRNTDATTAGKETHRDLKRLFKLRLKNEKLLKIFLEKNGDKNDTRYNTR